jgi:uncharacterized protein
MTESVEVTDNQDGHRFEATVEKEVAELVYRLRAGRLVLTHTEVPPALEGHGIGGKLVQAALNRARRDGLTVVPLCPFARSWLERHPEEASDVAIDWGDEAV